MRHSIVSILSVLILTSGCSDRTRLAGYTGPVNCLVLIGDDVWAGTPRGLVRFPNSGKPELFLWSGTKTGTIKASSVKEMSPDIQKSIDACSGINQIRGICQWNDGVALATAGGVVLFSTGKAKYTRFWTSRDGLGNESVRSVFAKGKQLWAATIFGASALNSNGLKWKNYDMASGLPARHTFCMEVYSGKLMVSCINGGLAWFDEPAGKWHIVPQENGLGNKYIYSMNTGKTGLWLGTAGGVNLFTFNNKWDEKTCSDGFTEYSVYAIKTVGDKLWFGTAYGLFEKSIAKEGKGAISQVKGLSSNDITSLCSSQKYIYIGTKSGVFRISNPN